MISPHLLNPGLLIRKDVLNIPSYKDNINEKEK